MHTTTQPIQTASEKLRALLATAQSKSIPASSFELWRRAEQKRSRA